MDELDYGGSEQRGALLAQLIATLENGLRIADQLDDFSAIGARLQNLIDDVQVEILPPQQPSSDLPDLRA